jgi:hypothetical protein
MCTLFLLQKFLFILVVSDKPGINTILIVCIVIFFTVLVIMCVILCKKIRKERVCSIYI